MRLTALAILAVIPLTLLGALPAGAQTAAEAPAVAGVEVGTIGAMGIDLVQRFRFGVDNPNLGEAVAGSPRHQVTLDGVTYLFTNKDNAAKFEKNPSRYLPALGCYCAMGMANNREWMPRGDPSFVTFIDGIHYCHGSERAEQNFESGSWDQVIKRRDSAVSFYRSQTNQTIAQEPQKPAS